SQGPSASSSSSSSRSGSDAVIASPELDESVAERLGLLAHEPRNDPVRAEVRGRVDLDPREPEPLLERTLPGVDVLDPVRGNRGDLAEDHAVRDQQLVVAERP